jgi:hypothetical protein
MQDKISSCFNIWVKQVLGIELRLRNMGKSGCLLHIVALLSPLSPMTLLFVQLRLALLRIILLFDQIFLFLLCMLEGSPQFNYLPTCLGCCLFLELLLLVFMLLYEVVG